MLKSVYVRKGTENVMYTCCAEIMGWYCGICGRGNLGFMPKKGTPCKVCKAKVYKTVRSSGDQEPRK